MICRMRQRITSSREWRWLKQQLLKGSWPPPKSLSRVNTRRGRAGPSRCVAPLPTGWLWRMKPKRKNLYGGELAGHSHCKLLGGWPKSSRRRKGHRWRQCASRGNNVNTNSPYRGLCILIEWLSLCKTSCSVHWCVWSPDHNGQARPTARAL